MKKIQINLFLIIISIIFFSIPLFKVIAIGCCKLINPGIGTLYGQCVNENQQACQALIDYQSGTYQWIEGGICINDMCVGGTTSQQQYTQTTEPIKLKLQIPIPGLPQEIPITGDTLGQYIVAFYKFFVGALAIIAVVMIMIGGFQWLMSAGSSDRVSRAKETISGAIVGLVLALTSYLLLYTLNPNLVSFGSLNIVNVNSQNLNAYCLSDDDCQPPYKCILETYQLASGGSYQEGYCMYQEECQTQSDCPTNFICQYSPTWGYKICQPGMLLPEGENFDQCQIDANCENCMLGLNNCPYCVIPTGSSSGYCLTGLPGSSCYESQDCISGNCNTTQHLCQ